MHAAVSNRIYLASQSPRRRELLRQIGVVHDVLLLRAVPGRGGDVDEVVHEGELPLAYVERVALAKAAFGVQVMTLRGLPRQAVLAADTAVCMDDEILGKPAHAADAEAMLARLCGRSHTVLTAVAMQLGERIESRVSRSTVSLRRLDPEQIHQYVQSGEPLDKAGAYAIQGRAGAFVAELQGSYSGVMGLPLFETADLLLRFGYKI